MTDKKSYISPKVETRDSQNGQGVFATQKIDTNEVIADFSQGPGQYINEEAAEKLYAQGYDYMIQVDDELYFAATKDDELEIGDFINHSCNPNCGIRGKLKIVAMRDIEPGEEICFDYAMSESSPYEMDCQCGSKNCRRLITGNDWKYKELQDSYRGYFSDYLARKVEALRKKRNPRYYISEKVRVKDSKKGKGVFASDFIKAGELIDDSTRDPGDLITKEEASELYKQGHDYMIQVDDNYFYATTPDSKHEIGDFINHSCDPNCGIKEGFKIVARRNINPGEEICFDYAMTESSDYQMNCNCGSKNCRKKITGNDWKIPELQKRYKGFFADYLQKKIDKL